MNKFKFIGGALVICIAVAAIAQGVVNVRSKWASGNLYYHSGATNVLGITSSGVSARPVYSEAGTQALDQDDSGGIFSNRDAGAPVTFTLPTSEAGLCYTFCVEDATNVYIDCAAADRILGTNADGDRLVADAAGESITLIGVGTTGAHNWIHAGTFGTWSDGN